MNEVKLGSKVRVVVTGMQGIVNAIWTQLEAAAKYEIVYYDNTGRRAESWLRAEEFEVL